VQLHTQKSTSDVEQIEFVCNISVYTAFYAALLRKKSNYGIRYVDICCVHTADNFTVANLSNT
jgi:hypothetical protein